MKKRMLSLMVAMAMVISMAMPVAASADVVLDVALPACCVVVDADGMVDVSPLGICMGCGSMWCPSWCSCPCNPGINPPPCTCSGVQWFNCAMHGSCGGWGCGC